jgi:hypothetical protein
VSKPQTTQFTNWDATLEGHEGKVEIDDDRNSRIEKRPQALTPKARTWAQVAACS